MWNKKNGEHNVAFTEEWWKKTIKIAVLIILIIAVCVTMFVQSFVQISPPVKEVIRYIQTYIYKYAIIIIVSCNLTNCFGTVEISLYLCNYIISVKSLLWVPNCPNDLDEQLAGTDITWFWGICVLMLRQPLLNLWHNYIKEKYVVSGKWFQNCEIIIGHNKMCLLSLSWRKVW